VTYFFPELFPISPLASLACGKQQPLLTPNWPNPQRSLKTHLTHPFDNPFCPSPANLLSIVFCKELWLFAARQSKEPFWSMLKGPYQRSASGELKNTCDSATGEGLMEFTILMNGRFIESFKARRRSCQRTAKRHSSR
jgi:hypothetical protein